MKRSPECSSAPGDRHDNDAPAVKKQRTTALSPSENSRAVKTSGLCTLQQEGLLHVQMDDDSKSIRAYPGFMLSALEKLQMDAHANDVEIRISVVVVVGKERSGTSTTVLHGIIGAFGDAVVRYEPCVYGSRTDGIEVSGVLLNGSEAGHIICVMEFHRFMSMNAVEFGSNLQRLAHTLLADTFHCDRKSMRNEPQVVIRYGDAQFYFNRFFTRRSAYRAHNFRPAYMAFAWCAAVQVKRVCVWRRRRIVPSRY